MKMNPVRRRLSARVMALSVEIYCPAVLEDRCTREDPIPAPDGSFQWLELPEVVTCPDCGRTYPVGRTIFM